MPIKVNLFVLPATCGKSHPHVAESQSHERMSFTCGMVNFLFAHLDSCVSNSNQNWRRPVYMWHFRLFGICSLKKAEHTWKCVTTSDNERSGSHRISRAVFCFHMKVIIHICMKSTCETDDVTCGVFHSHVKKKPIACENIHMWKQSIINGKLWFKSDNEVITLLFLAAQIQIFTYIFIFSNWWVSLKTMAWIRTV